MKNDTKKRKPTKKGTMANQTPTKATCVNEQWHYIEAANKYEQQQLCINDDLESENDNKYTKECK